MIGILITAIKIIFILGFLVFIHEGGHFIVAKLCKVKVNEFAIGFGPTIWSKQGKETKYALRLVPLGGFVNMEGEEERSDAEGSFSNASIPRRIAIVAAGGLVNIIFALIVYFTLMSFTGDNVSNVIDSLKPGYGAEVAGIQIEDEIIKIDGKRIRNKKDLDKAIQKCNGNTIEVEIKRNGEKQIIQVEPTEQKYNYTGIYLSTKDNKNATEIVAIYPNSPAEKCGIQVGDIVLEVNETNVENDVLKLVETIENSKTIDIKFKVKRDNKTMDFTAKAEQMSSYYLGVNLRDAEKNIFNNCYYAFWETGYFASGVLDNIRMLFTGKVRINQLMGPVGIGGVVAETNGFSDFVYTLALISISLGATNLLPFPPLDGGKIVILLIEAIRRKPLKEKTETTIQLIGFGLLIGLSIIVTYNDVLRIF